MHASLYIAKELEMYISCSALSPARHVAGATLLNVKPGERVATLNVLFVAFVPLRIDILNVRLLLKMCLGGGEGEAERAVKMQSKC